MATVAPRNLLQATSGVTPLASASPVQVFAGQTQNDSLGPLQSAYARTLRIYVTSIVLSNSAGTAAIVSILDGVTVLFAVNVIATNGLAVVNLSTPLRGTAGTALNIQSSSASANINWTVTGYAAQ